MELGSNQDYIFGIESMMVVCRRLSSLAIQCWGGIELGADPTSNLLFSTIYAGIGFAPETCVSQESQSMILIPSGACGEGPTARRQTGGKQYLYLGFPPGILFWLQTSKWRPCGAALSVARLVSISGGVIVRKDGVESWTI